MMIVRKIFPLLLLPLIFTPVFAQNLVINEFLPSNVSTIADEDGDFSDWIEFYNAGTVTLNLKDFGLSDNESAPFKWTFPDMIIAPLQFLLVFASGKDIRKIPVHWETIIDMGDEWKYFVPTAEPAFNWRNINSDDTDWLTGKSGFGYGDDDDSTDVGSPDPFQPSPISIFVRKKFHLVELSQIVSAILHVDYDDGFVAYLNGVEIARVNMGGRGTFPAFNQFATASHEAQMYQGGLPEKFVIDNPLALLTPGENILAIQVHNVELFSSDLSLILFFTLEMNSIPPNVRGPSSHLQFPPSPKMHTNFKINAVGETLILSDSSGKVLDKVTTGYIPPDVSFGRQPDGNSNWYFFNEPTPETNNDRHGYWQFAPDPQFSLPGGSYQNTISVSLSINAPGASIRYTTDGSAPTESSAFYLSPISISSTTVLRARAFGQNLLPGKTITQTYFINQNFTIPVISLSTNPANLWNQDMGIYVYGKNADTLNYPYWGSNFWQDWERPIHIEFYESDGSQGFSIDAGVKIFGSWSRLYPQKSLAIFARTRYGDDEIDYPIFPDKSITKFQSIILRNSGQDWGRTFFRDAMMQYLVKDTGLDIQAYRPVMVFLNGEIWGIHNIREKMNEHYLVSNHSADPENLDFIERDSMVIHGDLEHYRNMLQFAVTHDLVIEQNFEYLQAQMIVENFMDYTQSVIYFANSDWPWNNVKCWRPKTPSGRWKWLLYDMDYGFHGGHLGPESNMFHEMRNQDNGTTLLFFKLLENKNYKQDFINRFADHLNITFEPNRVIGIIDQFKAGIEPAMPFHIDKWKNSFQGPWWLGKSIDSMEEWYSHIQVAIDFAQRRGDFIRHQLMQEFGLVDGGMGTIHLNVFPANAGKIKINSQIIKTYPWSGKYFIEIPIRITALPNPGFLFRTWNRASPADSSQIEISITDGQSITAVFEPDPTTFGSIVINEINYNSSPNFNTEDWIELLNTGENGIDISNWTFKDSDDNHCFIIPENTILQPGEYLVVCSDRSAFFHFFPDRNNSVGDFGFGLSSDGELIRLYDARGNFIDSLSYDIDSPWQTLQNGQGYTLELIDPTKDNSFAQNWGDSKIIGGTPGLPNSIATKVLDSTDLKPLAFELYQNSPNPFNSQTAIRFALPKSENVSIRIYNILGEEITTLADQIFPVGEHKILWDGTTASGTKLSSGIYFCYLKTNSFQKVVKLVMLQ